MDSSPDHLPGGTLLSNNPQLVDRQSLSSGRPSPVSVIAGEPLNGSPMHAVIRNLFAGSLVFSPAIVYKEKCVDKPVFPFEDTTGVC
jgi:hypothetical protein